MQDKSHIKVNTNYLRQNVLKAKNGGGENENAQLKDTFVVAARDAADLLLFFD